MLATVGFETLEVYTWGRAACFVCAPRDETSSPS